MQPPRKKAEEVRVAPFEARHRECGGERGRPWYRDHGHSRGVGGVHQARARVRHHGRARVTYQRHHAHAGSGKQFRGALPNVVLGQTDHSPRPARNF